MVETIFSDINTYKFQNSYLSPLKTNNEQTYPYCINMYKKHLLVYKGVIVMGVKTYLGRITVLTAATQINITKEQIILLLKAKSSIA